MRLFIPIGQCAFLALVFLLLCGGARAELTLDLDGWSDPTVGTWDPVTRTATLTRNVAGPVYILADGTESLPLTLDGQGFGTIYNWGSKGYGVFVEGRSWVVVRNFQASLTIGAGVTVSSSSHVVVEDSVMRETGPILSGSSDCTLRQLDVRWVVMQSSEYCLIADVTTAGDMSGWGMQVLWCFNSIIERCHCARGIRLYNYATSECNNTLRDNVIGRELVFNPSKDNLILNNTVIDGVIRLQAKDGFGASGNTFQGNLISGAWYGVEINNSNGPCNNNVFTENTITDTERNAVHTLYYTEGNQFYNNNFTNIGGAVLNAEYETPQIFWYRESPRGGNYHDFWSPPSGHPDDDGDGFVDEAYEAYGVFDAYPWAEPNGWENQNSAPTAVAGLDQVVRHKLDTVQLSGAGSTDPDEGDELTYAWTLIAPEGSASVLYDPTAIDPTFVPDLPGDYVAELVVSDTYGVSSDPDFATITATNAPPVAVAGEDLTVHPDWEFGTVVALDGSASFDEEMDLPLTFLWEIVDAPEGSLAELTEADTASPSLTVDELGYYTVELVVTDSFGDSGLADQVTVSTVNSAPVADAGPDQPVTLIGEVVQLDGSGSLDDDGDPITYSWELLLRPEGSLAELSDTAVEQPTFVADVHGDYLARLSVTDYYGAVSAPDDVVLSFENVRPVAEAGLDQSVWIGDTVILDGTGSSDANLDPLTHSWTMVERPEGSQAVIGDSTAAQTSFTADVSGVYLVNLVVNDGFEDSVPSAVRVNARSVEDAIVQAIISVMDAARNVDHPGWKGRNLRHRLVRRSAFCESRWRSSVRAARAASSPGRRGLYQSVLASLRIARSRCDGFATAGAADQNDWILSESGQALVYPLVVDAISLVEQVLSEE